MRIICEAREHIVFDDQRRGHIRIQACDECKRLQARRWKVVRLTPLAPMVGMREEILAECPKEAVAFDLIGALARLFRDPADEWYVENPDGTRWKLMSAKRVDRGRKAKKRKR